MPKLYSKKAAADYLGLCVRTLERFIAQRKITIVRVGGSIRIPEDSLAAFIERHTVRGNS